MHTRARARLLVRSEGPPGGAKRGLHRHHRATVTFCGFPVGWMSGVCSREPLESFIHSTNIYWTDVLSFLLWGFLSLVFHSPCPPCLLPWGLCCFPSWEMSLPLRRAVCAEVVSALFWGVGLLYRDAASLPPLLALPGLWLLVAESSGVRGPSDHEDSHLLLAPFTPLAASLMPKEGPQRRVTRMRLRPCAKHSWQQKAEVAYFSSSVQS